MLIFGFLIVYYSHLLFALDINPDDIIIPQYSLTEPIIISEGVRPGSLLTTLRAKAPNGKLLDFQCYVDGFLCSTKRLLTTIYETIYELKIFANQTYENVNDVIPFYYGIVIFDAKNKSETLTNEYSGLLLVEHANDHSPEFTEEGLTMSIAPGVKRDTVFSPDLYVNDADSGRNGEVSVICVPEESINDGCLAFNISLHEKSHGHYQVNLIAQPSASAAKPGQDFGLKLIAMDHPLNISKQLAGETLILINVEGGSNINTTSTRSTTYVTEETETDSIMTSENTTKDDVNQVFNSLSPIFATSVATSSHEINEDNKSSEVSEMIPKETQTLPNNTSEETSDESSEFSSILNETSTVSVPQIEISSFQFAPHSNSPEHNLSSSTIQFNINQVTSTIIVNDTTTSALEQSTLSYLLFNNSTEATDQEDEDIDITTVNPILAILNETGNFTDSTENYSSNLTEITSLPIQSVTLGPQQNVITLEMDNSNIPILINTNSLRNQRPILGLKIRAKPKFLQIETLPYMLSLIDENNFAASAFDVWPNEAKGQSVIYLLSKNVTLIQNIFDNQIQFNFEILAKAESWNTSIKINFQKEIKDEILSSPVYQNYDFNIFSNFTKNQTIGNLKDILKGAENYAIQGSNSNLFNINSDGTLAINCREQPICLQEIKEKVSLLVTYESSGAIGHAFVTINILPSELSTQMSLKFSSLNFKIINGSVVRPVVITASKPSKLDIFNDDLKPYFELKELKKNFKWFLMINEIPQHGNYTLILNQIDMKNNETIITTNFPIIVEGVSQIWRFSQKQYNVSFDARTVTKGAFVLQFQIKGPRRPSIEYYIVDDTIGWLQLEKSTGILRVGEIPEMGLMKSEQIINIVAIDGEKKFQLTYAELFINVSDPTFVPDFTKVLNTLTLPSDTAVGSIVFNSTFISVLPKQYELSIVRDSFKATNKMMKNIPRPMNPFVLLQNGSLQLVQLLSKLDYSSITFNINMKSNSTIKSTTMLIYVGPAAHSTNASAIFASPWTYKNRYFAIFFPENVPVGYIVSSLPALDPSTLSIINDVHLTGTYADHFNIDTKTGIITLIRPFDFERLEHPKFQLTIHIAGEASNGTWATFNVTVIDVDDSSPHFINKTFNVNFEENSPTGQIVSTIGFYDPDTVGRDFTFKLTGEGAEKFQLKRKIDSSVDLTVAPLAQFDYESDKKIYNLILIIYDGAHHEDSCSILITLLDSNDHSPVFVKSNYEVQISEDLLPGSAILKISANDMDTGDNGNVVYSMTSNDDLFQIALNTGEVKTVSNLINKARPEPYILEITATDHGDPPNSATTKTLVTVTESVGKGKQLLFVKPPLKFLLKIKENIPINSTIYTSKAIRAYLHDDYLDIKYSLAKVGNYLDFSIEPYTGNIRIISSPDRERKNEYSIVIVAVDELVRSNGTEIYRLLTIQIEDEDDNTPQFDRDIASVPVAFTINADAPIGTSVGYVLAKDKDFASNNEFHYNLACGNDSAIFKIDSTSGLISTSQLLPLTKDEYMLQVLATNGPNNGSIKIREICQQNKTNVLNVLLLVNRKIIKQQALLMIKNHSRISLGRSAIADRFHTMLLAEENLHNEDITYRLVEVQKLESQKRDTSVAPQNLFSISYHSGAISANPELLAGPQAVYQLKSEAVSTDGTNLGYLLTYVDIVKDVNKLKFVFSLSLGLLESNLTQSSHILMNEIKQKSKDTLELVLDSPFAENSFDRSSACFHLIKEDNILNFDESLMEIKRLTDVMQPVYSNLSIIDIKECAAQIQSASFKPTEMVLLIFCGALLLLIVGATLGYFILVKKYKNFMLEKEQYNAMKNESSCSENSPELSRSDASEQSVGYEWKEKSCILD